MRTFHSALLAGVAAAAIGFSGAALAQSSGAHVMTVRLPDGGLAQIHYTGNIAPQVSFNQAPAPVGFFAPMPVLFGSESPFAQLDRISAEMDRQAAAMFRQAEALAAAPSGSVSDAAMRNLPAGSNGYSFVSTMSGNGVCSQSVEITSQGNGGAPKIVRHSSGNCAVTPDTGATAGSVNLPTDAPSVAQPSPVWISAPQAAPIPTQTAPHPDILWTSAHGAKPYAGLVTEIPPAR